MLDFGSLSSQAVRPAECYFLPCPLHSPGTNGLSERRGGETCCGNGSATGAVVTGLSIATLSSHTADTKELFSNLVWPEIGDFVASSSFVDIASAMSSLAFLIGENVTPGESPFLWLGNDRFTCRREGPPSQVPNWLAKEADALGMLYLGLAMSTVSGSHRLDSALSELLFWQSGMPVDAVRSVGVERIVETVLGFSRDRMEAFSLWEWVDSVQELVRPEVERRVLGDAHNVEE
ncbi:hypothetical protein UVI_02063910 [Ustilaginoidea virens]|uniref:Uncharacterized protein n=1 Tax=Ustilaginoidea virens TaxID=1159556 RepID=A0A1B5V8M1_USTVR|nr:hypothetical protein UVI_02063910 [Ustilaginoidea virens]